MILTEINIYASYLYYCTIIGIHMSLKKCELFSCAWLFVTLWTVAPQAPLSWHFPGKNTGVGCHFLLWGSSQPRDWTWVSGIASRLFTVWATREAPSPYVFIFYQLFFFFPITIEQWRIYVISLAVQMNSWLITLFQLWWILLFILHIGRWSCIIVIHLWQVVKM